MQSVETFERKGFVIFESARKCRGVRKQQEVKGIGRKHVERLEGLKVGMLKSRRLRVPT